MRLPAHRATKARSRSCCLDLDGFKAVNDLHGHAAGDRLLREVAARFNGNVRETDIVARLGGDEFVVVLHSVWQPQQACSFAERLVAALAEPYDLDIGTLQGVVTASIGIALFPSDGGDPNRRARTVRFCSARKWTRNFASSEH